MSTWNTHITVPRYGLYLDLDRAERAGYINSLLMELPLEAYLAMSHNRGVGGPTIPLSKHCGFSIYQVDKSFWAQAGNACALSSITMLQTSSNFSGRAGITDAPDGPLEPLLNKVRVPTSYILHVSSCVALFLAERRHLQWGHRHPVADPLQRHHEERPIERPTCNLRGYT